MNLYNYKFLPGCEILWGLPFQKSFFIADKSTGENNNLVYKHTAGSAHDYA